MAQLNLRDRVIETTIAYVGDAVSNFTHVTSDPQRGRAGIVEESLRGENRVLSVDWRPRATFNDCDLRVRLIASARAEDAESAEHLLVDADGLVLVLDSDPEALERNQRAVDIVRDAVAKAPQLPVVVQVNRREGDGDEAPLESLKLEQWPRISACAGKGEGVMETLQRAVDGVVDSMQGGPNGPEATPRPPGLLRAEGNPLLGALRHVLATTIQDQANALETRLFSHVDARLRDQTDGALAMSARIAAFDARIERMEAALAQVAEGSKREAGMSPRDMERIREDIVNRLRNDAAVHRDALIAEIKEQRKSFRDESLRAITAALQPLQKALDGGFGKVEAATEAVRKQLESTTEMLKKQMEAAGEAQKKQVEAAMEPLKKQVEALSAASRTITTRVDEVSRSVQELDSHVGSRADEVGAQLRALDESSAGRLQETNASLAAVIDELQKKKKSWFSA